MEAAHFLGRLVWVAGQHGARAGIAIGCANNCPHRAFALATWHSNMARSMDTANTGSLVSLLEQIKWQSFAYLGLAGILGISILGVRNFCLIISLLARGISHWRWYQPWLAPKRERHPLPKRAIQRCVRQVAPICRSRHDASRRSSSLHVVAYAFLHGYLPCLSDSLHEPR